MDIEQKKQLRIMFENMRIQLGYIPFFADVLEHKVFGNIVRTLPISLQKEIPQCINDFIVDSIKNYSTKGGDFFCRFFDSYTDLFWSFRNLNSEYRAHQNIEPKGFQKVGKDVEEKLFMYEGLLTQKMLQKTQGLHKTVDAFYTIVYLYFPYYNKLD